MADMEEIIKLKAQASQFRSRISELEGKLEDAERELAEAKKTIAGLETANQQLKKLASEKQQPEEKPDGATDKGSIWTMIQLFAKLKKNK